MLSQALRAIHLAGDQDLDFIAQTAYVYGVTIACEADGQVITIKDKGTPELQLIPSRSLKTNPAATDPLWMVNPFIVEWVNGKFMNGGIHIKTVGGGACSVWIDYQTGPIGSGV